MRGDINMAAFLVEADVDNELWENARTSVAEFAIAIERGIAVTASKSSTQP
jgi:hypothetical protein